MPLSGTIIGNIHINVCKTPDGDIFFYINAENEEVLPVLHIIEDTLQKY